MAQRARRPCAKIGCPELIAGGTTYCDKHKQSYDKYRGNSTARGYGYGWSIIRLRFLQRFPLCADCESEHMIVPATEAHHVIKKINGGSNDFVNLLGLCKKHHSTRTLRGE